jgi:hypothetical protein
MATKNPPPLKFNEALSTAVVIIGDAAAAANFKKCCNT